MRLKKLKRFMIRKAPHLLLLAALFAVSFLIGSYLPQNIALHWDKFGIIDRIGSKLELILLLPCASIVIFAIGIYAESRLILPSRKLRGLISFMQFFFLLLVFIIQVRNLLRAAEVWTPLEQLMSIPVLLLYAYVANAFDEADYLSVFGVKTKWTMQNPEVWRKTNHMASRLFQTSAGMMLIPLFIYRLFYLCLFIPPILSFIIAVVYSRVIAGKYGNGGD